VISTGLYAIVRHPMYTAALALFLGTPLALASWWGLVPAALLLAALVWRLLDEESYLARNLPGYTDYQRRVRTRLVPGIW
jgi:protein-S-isoprenylcysteine O-methyltransferase Ste14